MRKTNQRRFPSSLTLSIKNLSHGRNLSPTETKDISDPSDDRETKDRLCSGTSEVYDEDNLQGCSQQKKSGSGFRSY